MLSREEDAVVSGLWPAARRVAGVGRDLTGVGGSANGMRVAGMGTRGAVQGEGGAQASGWSEVDGAGVRWALGRRPSRVLGEGGDGGGEDGQRERVRCGLGRN